MRIFSLCGSIRPESSHQLLMAFSKNFLKNHHWTSIALESLPFFSPDEQFSETTPEIVRMMRRKAEVADLIFITTPEYAHSAPGILKNALEWLFCEGTQKKPVAFVIGSAQGEHTQAQLIETLTTMDFIITASESLILKGLRSKISNEAQITDQDTRRLLEEFLIRITSR
jgi:chromate reductase